MKLRSSGQSRKQQAVTLSQVCHHFVLLQKLQFTDMMPTGDVFSAQWDIPEHSLILEKVDLYFESSAGKLKIIENGVSTGYSEEEATKILSQSEVTAIADVKMGCCICHCMGMRPDS